MYYVHPVAVEQAEGMIQSVILATKSGPRRVVARQFVDASEKGQLLKLAGHHVSVRKPVRNELYMYLQHLDWPVDAGGEKTIWETQRLFTHVMAPQCEGQSIRQATEQAIASLSEIDKQGVLSHVSVEPYPIYEACEFVTQLQGNLAVASPACVGDAIAAPADRCMLGLRAAMELARLSVAKVSVDLLGVAMPVIKPVRELATDVLVAGVGTGGAIAAIAAADQGSKVTAIDPFSFPGGIGTGGGIHTYYYGIPGGLQDVIDTQTREMMKAHGQVLTSHQYNPVAKMIVLEKHFARTGVNFISHSLLCDVTVENGMITSVLVATEDGPIRITAKAYIDGTGDGDLAAKAGADYEIGRESDGLLHAYSQPTGFLHIREHNIRSGARNFDAGWCDPTDADDLTRARMTGIAQQQLDRATNEQRVTYLCPAMGLRQARQIKTDYVITLDDQVTGRFCEDVIGYAGSNYDAHTADYPLESDEGMFWVCLTRSWHTGFVTPLPYRCLLPLGLKNVWIASRCLGISQDAHYAIRMMRDMQRIGEASGYAAASFVSHGLRDSREVPIAEVQRKLKDTGALVDDMTTIGPGWFESACQEMASRDTQISIEQDPRVQRALAHLVEGQADGYFWILMKNRDVFEAQVLDLLRKTDNDRTRWFAAGIVAMWGSPEAECVLIDVVKNRTFGYDKRGDDSSPYKSLDPLVTARSTQDWLTAVCLLRVCGSNKCLPVLDDLLASHKPTLLTVVSVLGTLEKLLQSNLVMDHAMVQQIVSRIDPKKVTSQFIIPQAAVTGLADVAVNGWEGKEPAPCQKPARWPYSNTAEDHGWQLTLMLAKLCELLGMDLPLGLDEQLQSDRALVRGALEKIQKQMLEAS